MTEWHSQFGQDQAVMELLGSPCRPRFFLDVGAADGVRDSNTLALQKLGWEGICIEADPAVFGGLKATREQNTAIPEGPMVECINVAVDNHVGVGDFRRVPVPGWSGLARPGIVRELNAARILEFEATGQAEHFEVPTATLNSILSRRHIGVVDYLSLDIEGAEMAALEGLNLEKVEVRIATIEVNRTDNALEEYMLMRGFCLWGILGTDDVFVNKDWMLRGRP